MKKVLLLIIIGLFTLNMYGQRKVELQLGGSNFYGLSANLGFDFVLSQDSIQYLETCIGFGTVAGFYSENTSMVHFGVNYRFKSFGGGIELSGFSRNPFSTLKNTHTLYYDMDMPHMIFYPNLNWTYTSKWQLYFKFSAGIYIPFQKSIVMEDFNYPNNPQYIFHEEYSIDDVIPGAGITLGYNF